MKKLFALLLALMITALLPFALAEEEPTVYASGDYEYILLPDGTVEIEDYNGSAQTLTVPAEIDGYRVTSIGESAFHYATSLRTITIPDSVTNIGVRAFSYCTSLTGVVIPGSVTSIGARAFYACSALTSAEIFEGVAFIGDNAFYACSALTSVTIPDSIVACGVNPFALCKTLGNISVSPSHPTLAVSDGMLFEKNTHAMIGHPGACAASSYAIPAHIEIVRNQAFAGWTSLTSVSIPDSVTIIEGNAFANCLKLMSILVSPAHPTFEVIDGVLFDRNDRALIWYPIAFTESRYAIPQGTRSIGEYAFNANRSLASVLIPDSVTSIGYFAFSNCSSLAQLFIPASVTQISEGVFTNSRALSGIAVETDSFAAQWCQENGMECVYINIGD